MISYLGFFITNVLNKSFSALDFLKFCKSNIAILQLELILHTHLKNTSLYALNQDFEIKYKEMECNIVY